VIERGGLVYAPAGERCRPMRGLKRPRSSTGQDSTFAPVRPHQIERIPMTISAMATVQTLRRSGSPGWCVIPRIEERHRSREFIAFMNDLLRAYRPVNST